jgi:hypothetical protein
MNMNTSKRHVMQTYRGLEVYFHIFLNSALVGGGGGWLQVPANFFPRE